MESLILKSEKAQRGVAPGTWQHAMLRDNLKALRIASALMGERMDKADGPSRDELLEAVGALASMAAKAEKARRKFLRGTPQHTLQRNRLLALRKAAGRIEAELKAGSAA